MLNKRQIVADRILNGLNINPMSPENSSLKFGNSIYSNQDSTNTFHISCSDSYFRIREMTTNEIIIVNYMFEENKNNSKIREYVDRKLSVFE